MYNEEVFHIPQFLILMFSLSLIIMTIMANGSYQSAAQTLLLSPFRPVPTIEYLEYCNDYFRLYYPSHWDKEEDDEDTSTILLYNSRTGTELWISSLPFPFAPPP